MLSLETVGHKSQSQVQGRERKDTRKQLVTQEEAEIIVNICFTTAGTKRGDMLEQADWQVPGLPGVIMTLMQSISQVC